MARFESLQDDWSEHKMRQDAMRLGIVFPELLGIASDMALLCGDPNVRVHLSAEQCSRMTTAAATLQDSLQRMWHASTSLSATDDNNGSEVNPADVGPGCRYGYGTPCSAPPEDRRSVHQVYTAEDESDPGSLSAASDTSCCGATLHNGDYRTCGAVAAVNYSAPTLVWGAPCFRGYVTPADGSHSDTPSARAAGDSTVASSSAIGPCLTSAASTAVPTSTTDGGAADSGATNPIPKGRLLPLPLDLWEYIYDFQQSSVLRDVCRQMRSQLMRKLVTCRANAQNVSQLVAHLTQDGAIDSLTIRCSGLGENGKTLAGLTDVPGLRTLRIHLKNNHVGDDVLHALATLKNAPDITSLTLDLGENQVGHSGTQALTVLKEAALSYLSISLDNNCVGDIGMLSLAMLWTSTTALTALTLNLQVLCDWVLVHWILVYWMVLWCSGCWCIVLWCPGYSGAPGSSRYGCTEYWDAGYWYTLVGGIPVQGIGSGYGCWCTKFLCIGHWDILCRCTG